MITMHLALILIVVLLIFAAAWRWLPSGWLTAATGSVTALTALIEAAQQGLGEHMAALKAVLPPEYQPALVIVFALLTIAARFRSKVSA